MVNKPTKAIITAAGLSSLFSPVSVAYPREMLMINNKPLIHPVVNEAIEAGIKEIIIVTDKYRSHNIIQSYFTNYEKFKKQLKKRNQYDKLNVIRELSKIKPLLTFEEQNEEDSKGHGGAILQTAENHRMYDEPFIVMFGDSITKTSINCTKSLIDAYEYYESPIFAVQNVQPSEVKYFGVIRGPKIGNDIYKIRETIEKPEISESPSSLAIMGRYICDRDIIESISKNKKEKITNIEKKLLLTDAMNKAVDCGKNIYAQRFFGEYFAISNELQLLKASLRFIIDDESKTKEIIEQIDDMNLKIQKLIQ